MKKLIDLHVHTTASDGTMTPYELVAYAKQKGIAAIAITDHDTISGIAEAVKVGNRLGVEVIPGIEISVDFGCEIHILGYFIKESEYLLKRLSELREGRNDRNIKIIQKLSKFGMNITIEEVNLEANGESIGRPHVARLMVKKGYSQNMAECFSEYLGEGGKAFVEREKITLQEGIELIIKSGGIPVLAHPRYLNQENLEETIKELRGYGLLGIEAYYSSNTVEETNAYISIAKKYNLVVTGGTDFHGKNKPEIDLGIGTGNLEIEYEILEKLKNKKKEQQIIY